MTYITEPARVDIYINTRKLTPAQIKRETGCDALVNGGDVTGIPPYKRNMCKRNMCKRNNN